MRLPRPEGLLARSAAAWGLACTVCRGLKACLHSLLLFFVLLCGLFYNSLLTLGAGLPLILGFTFLPAHSLIAIMSCYITLSFLPMGSCVPFVFPWASLAHLLVLGFLGSFTNFVFLWAFTDFIGLPRLNYFILILGFMGLLSIPYSLCLHCFGLAAAHSYFFSHHTLPMGLLLTISLFPGSFEPICFLKTHLLIS